MIKKNYIKLIFGLKLKQLRTDKTLSLSDLANKCNLSISYLNEIESGKKYPKADKIAALAETLGTTYDKLVSLKLVKNLAPIGDLLESNILEQLPLDHYGIDINKLIFLMSNSSMQLSALIATFIETAKNSELSQNNFSRNALRIFKEFNENYFEDLEDAVKQFSKENKLKEAYKIEFKQLKHILEKKYNYEIDESTLSNYPELNELRAVVAKNKLILNNKLSEAQKTFVAGREIAYNYLGIKDRSYIHSNVKLNTFDQLLNYFKASYFSTALIINSNLLISDLGNLFKMSKWNEEKFLAIMNKFNSTTEMFFQRITNLSSSHLGLNKFFFFRINYDKESNELKLQNELKLNVQRNFGEFQINEHICRRWISIEVIKQIENNLKKENNFNKRIAGILHSKFFESDDEYLCFSVAQRGNLVKDQLSSITIGFQIDDVLKSKINFWNDSKIRFKIVNDTCERCNLTDCKERAAQPTSAVKIEKYFKIENALQKLMENDKH